jgi:hypothetical protein
VKSASSKTDIVGLVESRQVMRTGFSEGGNC